MPFKVMLRLGYWALRVSSSETSDAPQPWDVSDTTTDSADVSDTATSLSSLYSG